MQPNEITLAVDELNDGTTVNAVFSRFEELTDRSTYISGGHDIALRDQLQLYRTFPKQTGNYRGAAKSAVKFTMDQSVLGVDGSSTIISPFIITVNFSIPVGVVPAQIVEMRQRAIALLDADSIMTPLNSTLMI